MTNAGIVNNSGDKKYISVLDQHNVSEDMWNKTRWLKCCGNST